MHSRTRMRDNHLLTGFAVDPGFSNNRTRGIGRQSPCWPLGILDPAVRGRRAIEAIDSVVYAIRCTVQTPEHSEHSVPMGASPYGVSGPDESCCINVQVLHEQWAADALIGMEETLVEHI